MWYWGYWGMNENKKIIEINTISDCANILGIEAQDPHIMLFTLEQVRKVEHQPMRFGFFSVACFWSTSNSDTDAMLSFYSPGYYEKEAPQLPHDTAGWILVFNIDLVKDSLLYNRLFELPFFSPASSTLIKLRPTERRVVVSCMLSLLSELNTPRDKFTSRILTSGIAVLLNISSRYYENQNTLTHSTAQSIVNNFITILDQYITSNSKEHGQIPTIASCAAQLGISANYLGDVVRSTLHISAQAYIHNTIISEAKYQLQHTKLSIGEIGYNFGFKYPHHFTRLFRKATGMSPSEYRTMTNKKA